MLTADLTRKRGTIDPQTAFTAFQRYGTYAETGRHLQLTRERIRQLLLIGQRQGLFVFQPPHQRNQRTLPALRTLTPRQIADKYPDARSVKTLSLTLGISYTTLLKHVPATTIRALTRFYATRSHTRVRDRIYTDYLQLHNQLGHHPSDTEIQQHVTGLSHRIRRHWKSIRRFRSFYGIRPPDSQLSVRASEARAREYTRLTALFQQGPQRASDLTSALTREVLRRLLREQRIYPVQQGRRRLYYWKSLPHQQLSA